MKKYLVTGCAGFIGSTLTDKLLNEGASVTGIDIFRDYYDVSIKRRNIASALVNPSFTLLEKDLSTGLDFLSSFIDSSDELVIYHLAAQAGVRKSWGTDFRIYTRDNIDATQNLLEWAHFRGGIKNFVYASSSSIYGVPAILPMTEDKTVPIPHSPYGVTKLAAENLVRLYTANMGLPSASLRFFTVYGPRQRPDMAFNRFIRAALDGKAIGVFGNGRQTRDFTYIDDIVHGLRLAEDSTKGLSMNLGGGNRVTLLHSIETLAKVMGREIGIEFSESKLGDVPDTWASAELAMIEMGWKPSVSLEEGLSQEVNWLLSSS
ncbi:MAG: GDP-mannose 4,6-dehydratase [Candidatus Sabulitectum sp.]|nr:GDP-mannose 4,6-dehydratase [Candidatus Sabulitectum sp.]